jgi:hypothetical protein
MTMIISSFKAAIIATSLFGRWRQTKNHSHQVTDKDNGSPAFA